MSGLPQDRNECTRNTCSTPKFWCGFLKERCLHISIKYCIVTGLFAWAPSVKEQPHTVRRVSLGQEKKT